MANGFGPGPPPFPIASGRSFVVGARAGLKGISWPGGRLYISPAGLRVRTIGGITGIDVSAPRFAITGISIGRGIYGPTLRIADTARVMAHVSVLVPFRRRAIVSELVRCGYYVQGRI